MQRVRYVVIWPPSFVLPLSFLLLAISLLFIVFLSPLYLLSLQFTDVARLGFGAVRIVPSPGEIPVHPQAMFCTATIVRFIPGRVHKYRGYNLSYSPLIASVNDLYLFQLLFSKVLFDPTDYCSW